MNQEAQDEKRAIAVLPAYDLLVDRSPQDWFKRFHEMSGVWPTDVALPGITNQGATFESDHVDEHRLIKPESRLETWIKELRDHNEDLRIWFLINPNYESIWNELMVIVDQWGEVVSGHACLSKPLVLKTTEAIIGELQALAPDGIVFDLTDVYPNTGSTLYQKESAGDETAAGLQNTCFCDECVAGLGKHGWNSGGANFRSGKLRLARFLLQSTPTGTSHIDVKQSWIDGQKEDLLLQYARERAFVEEEGDEEETDRQRVEAQEVLRYLGARGKFTAQAVRNLCRCVDDANLRFALILGDADFDLAQNTSLTYLARAEAADEYWVPLSQMYSIPEGEANVVQFLGLRGTYYCNSLFEDIWHILNSRNDDITENEARLRRTAGRIRGDGTLWGLSKGGAKVASMSEETRGFAGVPFEREDIAGLIRRIGRDHPKLGRFNAVVRAISSVGPSADEDGGEPANPLYE